MDSKLKILSVSLLAVVGSIQAANAALIEQPLPDNAYISFNGYDWAWASPQPATLDESTFTLDYQSQFGWRLPSEDELAQAPTPFDFIFPGANVPLGGEDPVSGATFELTNELLTGDAACATPYFNTERIICQWGDMVTPEGEVFPWAGQEGWDEFSEQLVIRLPGEGPSPGPEKPEEPGTPPPSAVPEPTTLSLIGLGLALV